MKKIPFFLTHLVCGNRFLVLCADLYDLGVAQRCNSFHTKKNAQEGNPASCVAALFNVPLNTNNAVNGTNTHTQSTLTHTSHTQRAYVCTNPISKHFSGKMHRQYPRDINYRASFRRHGGAKHT